MHRTAPPPSPPLSFLSSTMSVSADKDDTSKPDFINTCCDQWKKKLLKAQESRNALRQAVKFLEHKINEIQAHNSKACVAKIEIGENLEENNARVPLESNELCSFESHIAAPKVQQQGCGGDARDGNENEKVQGFQACIAERDEEICRLKGLLEAEKRKADFERKKAAEARKLLEEEKDKSAEKGMQIARIEAEKAGEYRVRISQLDKQVSEAKQKLTSKMSTFKVATKRFEAEKHKILAEKRNAELGMAKANEKLEVEKHKAIEEKRRVDAEMVKLEEQKALAEHNWNKFMEEKRRADQMYQQLEEYKRTIEDLKRKMHELSSLRKPTEMAADISVNAESSQSTKLELLKSQLKLEKLRAKHSKQKYKSEANRYSILRHQLGHLKIGFVQLLHRFDVLDASFSPVSGSIHDQTKNSNLMRQACKLNLSQMHSQFENELLEPCCPTMDACDPLRKNMQPTPLLALSGGNHSESITGNNCISSYRISKIDSGDL